MKLTDSEEGQLRRGRGGGGGWWGCFSLPEVKDGNDAEREVFPLLYRMIQEREAFPLLYRRCDLLDFISVYFLYGR